MVELNLFYVTNRNHQGSRWNPKSYGTKFSDDGAENLRFGKLALTADEAKINEYMSAKKHNEVGDGEKLADYLSKEVGGAKIIAYKEKLESTIADIHQDQKRLGSNAMLNDLRQLMLENTDVLIYIHGFNVSWNSAVGSALALQIMLNRPGVGTLPQHIAVVMFTWPSDGQALPFVSYKSDRTEAKSSGYAFGRGILKLRDFLATIKRELPEGARLCEQDIHLLCHSMGNFVFQSSLERVWDHTPGSAMPRAFEHIFMCAPDVDDNVFEPGKPMANANELCRYLTVYYNKEDMALHISDYTKGNPERLGSSGAARPSHCHNKINQVDCTPLVEGGVEHSYYLWGPVNTDIRLSLDGTTFDAPQRRRVRDNTSPNVWRMK